MALSAMLNPTADVASLTRSSSPRSLPPPQSIQPFVLPPVSEAFPQYPEFPVDTFPPEHDNYPTVFDDEWCIHYTPPAPSPPAHPSAAAHSAASDSSIEIVSDIQGGSKKTAARAPKTVTKRKAQPVAAPDDDESEPPRAAKMELITPAHTVEKKKGKKVTSTRVKEKIVPSKLFNFLPGLDDDDLTVLLAKVARTPDLDLDDVSWRFDKSRSVQKLGGKAGLEYFRKELAQCSKLVIFSFTLDVPQKTKAKKKQEAKKAQASDASESEAASDSSGSDSSDDDDDFTLADLSKLSASKRIAKVSKALLARYPKGRCQQHRDVHCYEDSTTGNHFDIGMSTRLTVFTAAIIKGEATFLKAPTTKHFGRAFALSGRGRSSTKRDNSDDDHDHTPRKRVASSSRRAATRDSSPIPEFARNMPLSEYTILGCFDEDVIVKLATIGHTPASKVRHIPAAKWQGAGITNYEFVTAVETDAKTRERIRTAMPDVEED